MEEKEFQQLMEKFQAESQPVIQKAVEDACKGHITTEALEEKVAGFASKADVDTLVKTVETQGIELLKIGKVSGKKDLKSLIKSAFGQEGLAEKLQQCYKNGSGVVHIIGNADKAVGAVTTGSVSTDTGGNAILDMINADEINQMRLADAWIDNYANVTRTSKPVYTYADYEPKEGDADWVGEGLAKPELDLQVSIHSETPVKAAAWTELSEEAITDIPRMESEARTNIFKKVMLRRQNGILFGDGLVPNPEGVTAIAAAFNAASWPNKEAASSTNLKDWVVGAANQIMNAENYTDDIDYMPNLAFVNPTNYNELIVKKAQTQGQYLFGGVQLGSMEQTLGAVNIIAKKQIPAGSLLIGDFTKLQVVNYIDFALKIGWVNDQFINNTFTMLGEARLYTFVKNLDQIAFIYDTFANIQAGMELP